MEVVGDLSPWASYQAPQPPHSLAVVAPKAKCWVRLASPSWSNYKESCVQLPMASLIGCHQLYGSSYDYHIIECTHVPRRPCRTLTLRNKVKNV